MSGIPKNFDSSQTISGKQTDIELFEFNEIKLESKILLSDGQTVFFYNNQFKKLVDFELACNRLSQNKLGILASAKKNESTLSDKKASCFIKHDINKYEEKEYLEIGKTLFKYQVDIIQYKSTFLKRKLNNPCDNDDEFLEDNKKQRLNSVYKTSFFVSINLI